MARGVQARYPPDMSENPYSQARPMGSGMDEFVEPERTSLLAIGSLICSLTCCLSPIGLLMGIGALVGISGSRGRVGGKGPALAGTIIGLLGTVLIIAAYLGAQSTLNLVTTKFFPEAGRVLTSVEQQDYDAVRASLISPSDSLATDAQIDAFRIGYRDTLGLGAFTGTADATGWVELFQAYAPFSTTLQANQGRNDMIPIVGQFENGQALIVIVFDQAAAQRAGSPDDFPVRNVIIELADGTSVALFDPVMLEAARNGRLDELFPGTERVPADQLPGAQDAVDDAAGDAAGAIEDAGNDGAGATDDAVDGALDTLDDDDGG